MSTVPAMIFSVPWPSIDFGLPTVDDWLIKLTFYRAGRYREGSMASVGIRDVRKALPRTITSLQDITEISIGARAVNVPPNA